MENSDIKYHTTLSDWLNLLKSINIIYQYCTHCTDCLPINQRIQFLNLSYKTLHSNQSIWLCLPISQSGALKYHR